MSFLATPCPLLTLTLTSAPEKEHAIDVTGQIRTRAQDSGPPIAAALQSAVRVARICAVRRRTHHQIHHTTTTTTNQPRGAAQSCERDC